MPYEYDPDDKFGYKDTLPENHPEKVITGVEFDDEFKKISGAIDALEDATTGDGQFVDAPSDNQLYGRKNRHWEVVDGGTGDWNTIENKPTEFPPSPHTHPWGEITDKPALIEEAPNDGKQYVRESEAWAEVDIPDGGASSWDEITGKPDTFPPSITYQIGTDKVTRSGEPAIELVDSDDNYTNVKFQGLNGINVTSDLQSIIIDGADVAGSAVQIGPTFDGTPQEGDQWMEVPASGDATMWIYDGANWLQQPGGKDGKDGEGADLWTDNGGNSISYSGTVTVTGDLLAAKSDAGANAFSAGFNAGETNQGPYTVAIGSQAGESNQEEACVALGVFAGQTSQGINSIAIGGSAGNNTQGNWSVSIGQNAGMTTQGEHAVAIGRFAAEVSQGSYAVAVGHSAGEYNQDESGIAVGVFSGQTSQGADAIAIGGSAGKTTQASWAVAIGQQAGYTNQGQKSVAIGRFAGQTSQGGWSVAIGNDAGYNVQGIDAVAVGDAAGYSAQSQWALAIGQEAGKDSQGEAAIAIGRQAGQTSQAAYGIIINSTGSNVDNTTAGHIVIKSSTHEMLSIPAGGFAINRDPIIGAKRLISTLSTLRNATRDETTLEGLRDALSDAIGGIVENLEHEISTMPVEDSQ